MGIVDALNESPDFAIPYPSSHEKQMEIAHAFQVKSAANFDCCAGAVDGILIWIHKPSALCCVEAGCNTRKFFCGQKHKFGFNYQAICDADGIF